MPIREEPANKRNHPYAGRWLARIGLAVLAQGSSPASARSAALQNRHKEKPIISYIPLEIILPYPDLFYQIQSALADREDIYLVGGAVRDALQQKTIHDLDFVCLRDAQSAARKTANYIQGDIYCMDAEHQVYRVIPQGKESAVQMIDFMLARSSAIEDDLRLRDFSINAMAVPLQDPQKLIDPLHGAMDLHRNVLTACTVNAFNDDAIRIMRGIRIAAEGGYHIEAATRELMKKSVPLLIDSSVERRREELIKIFMSHKPDAGIKALVWLKALEKVLPEYDAVINSSKEEWMHQLLRGLASSTTLLDILIHKSLSDGATDITQGIAINALKGYQGYLANHISPARASVHPPLAIWYIGWLASEMATALQNEGYAEDYARWLHLSRQEVQIIKNIPPSLHRMRDWAISQTTPENLDIYRFFRDFGDAGIAASWIWLSQQMAKHPLNVNPVRWAEETDLAAKLWKNYWLEPELIHPPEIINGNDIIREMKIPPGEVIGEYLEIVREAQVSGKIHTQTEAFQLLRSSLKE